MPNDSLSLTPSRHELLVSETSAHSCHNCSSDLHGRYCHRCGQPVRPLDPTFHDLWHEFIHEFLHVDGKIWRSLKLLLIKPGALTDDFLHGRRARHIGPFRLYLTISVIFFFLIFHLPDNAKGKIIATGDDDKPVAAATQSPAAGQPADKDDSDEKTEQAVTNALQIDGAVNKQELKDKIRQDVKQAVADKKSDAPKDNVNLDLGDNPQNKKLSKLITDSLNRAKANPEEFKHATLERASHAMFFMLPFFALLLRVLYRKTGLHYPACLYFSIHFHAFFFLLLSLSFALTIATLGWLQIPAWIFWLIGLGYLFLALRRVFGGEAKPTVWNICKLMVAYLPMLGVVLAGSAVSAFLF